MAKEATSRKNGATTGARKKPVPPVEHQFKPGNPGRPKGARNKLGEAFLHDVLADWEQHGPAVIKEVREESPDKYLKVVASILPKELNVKVSELDDLSDDEIEQQLASIAAQLARAGFGIGEGEASKVEPHSVN